MADDERILIPCEGSGSQPASGVGTGASGIGMCSMCGGTFAVEGYRVVSHARDDILARIDRGDFG